MTQAGSTWILILSENLADLLKDTTIGYDIQMPPLSGRYKYYELYSQWYWIDHDLREFGEVWWEDNNPEGGSTYIASISASAHDMHSPNFTALMELEYIYIPEEWGGPADDAVLDMRHDLEYGESQYVFSDPHVVRNEVIKIHAYGEPEHCDKLLEIAKQRNSTYEVVIEYDHALMELRDDGSSGWKPLEWISKTKEIRLQTAEIDQLIEVDLYGNQPCVVRNVIVRGKNELSWGLTGKIRTITMQYVKLNPDGTVFKDGDGEAVGHLEYHLDIPDLLYRETSSIVD